MPGVWESLRLLKKLPVTTPFPVKGQRAVHVSEPVVGSRAIYCAYDKGEFTAFDKVTLAVLWKRPSEGFEPGREWSERLLEIGKLGGDVAMLDLKSGTRLWTRPTLSGGAKPWRGRLLIARLQGYEIVEPHTGSVEREVDVPGGLTDATVLCGDVTVGATYPGGDPARAFSLVEERVLWERQMLVDMEARFGVVHSDRGMSFVPGSVPSSVVLTRTGSVFGCSLHDGSLLWHARVSVPYYWPNVHEGRIYVLCVPRFIAIDEASGEIVYDVKHRELEEVLFAKTGTIHGGKVAFATESGHLPVFDLTNGRLVWLYKYKGSLGRTAEADGRLLVTTGRGELLVFADEANAVGPG